MELVALRIVRGPSVESEDVYAESEGSAASDGDWSSTSSEEEHDYSAKSTKLSKLLSYVYDQIDLLHHLSMLLRQPALTGRYLKSTARDDKPSAFAPFDYSHVVEKLRHWQRIAESDAKDETLSQQSATSCVEPDEKPAVSENDVRARMDLESNQVSYGLIKRLARANTRRREQLNYWANHRPDSGGSPTGKTAEKEVVSKSQAHLAAAEQEITEAGGNAPKAKSLGKQEAKSVLSTPTTQSFSTAAISGIDGERAPGARPRTIYEETVVATGRRSTRVPDVPIRDPGHAQFECPFCHMSLNSALMKDRQSWKYV